MEGKKAILPVWFQARAIAHFTLLLCRPTPLLVHRQRSRSSCQWSTAVKRRWHLVMEAAVPWAGKFLLPVTLPHRCIHLGIPTAYGQSDERQSWNSHQSVQPSRTRELSLRLVRWPSSCSTPERARPGKREDQTAKSCKEKKGKSKANLPFLGMRLCCRPRSSLNTSLRNYRET